MNLPRPPTAPQHSHGPQELPAPRCQFCGEPVNPELDWRRVVGWERRRAQGGTNAVALREPLGQWACRTCIDLRRSGHAGQGTLLG